MLRAVLAFGWCGMSGEVAARRGRALDTGWSGTRVVVRLGHRDAMFDSDAEQAVELVSVAGPLNDSRLAGNSCCHALWLS